MCFARKGGAIIGKAETDGRGGVLDRAFDLSLLVP